MYRTRSCCDLSHNLLMWLKSQLVSKVLNMNWINLCNNIAPTLMIITKFIVWVKNPHSPPRFDLSAYLKQFCLLFERHSIEILFVSEIRLQMAQNLPACDGLELTPPMRKNSGKKNKKNITNGNRVSRGGRG